VEHDRYRLSEEKKRTRSPAKFSPPPSPKQSDIGELQSTHTDSKDTVKSSDTKSNSEAERKRKAREKAREEKREKARENAHWKTLGEALSKIDFESDIFTPFDRVFRDAIMSKQVSDDIMSLLCNVAEKPWADGSKSIVKTKLDKLKLKFQGLLTRELWVRIEGNDSGLVNDDNSDEEDNNFDSKSEDDNESGTESDKINNSDSEPDSDSGERPRKKKRSSKDE